jgi:hypothetical protein
MCGKKQAFELERGGDKAMLVTFWRLPIMKHDPWIRLKCFYDQDGKYGEFFINIHPFKKIILIQSKDGFYETVLTAAFQKAMQEL